MPRTLPRNLSLFALAIALIVGCAPGSSVADPATATNNDGKKKHKANRLAKESSPYLLLHAHNPVDWYPWGPEAFEKAKKENKPIFLSVGYSSCYWCHVMERKVFMNEEIAKFMNKHFINIKVDREERPDLDDIYMTSLTVYFQAIGSGQGGGWPLSMFLTPEGKPFAGGTYFPPETIERRTGFPTVLKKVHELWTTKEKALRGTADRLTDAVRRSMKPRPVLRVVKIDRAIVNETVKSLMETYDEKYGGLGFRAGNPDAAKFPVPAKLALLQQAARDGDKKAQKVLDHTLDAIAAGGIRDHLGGGFHRYSTDRRWHLPHFEKMLYDQSQLAEVYVKAYQRTGKPAYKEAAEGIFRFVLRKMTDPKGGFYSALDAETEGVEGEYYVWSKKQVEKVLGEKDAKLFRQVYGMNEEKRFEHGYVLHLPKPLAEVAKARKIPLPELKTRLARMRAKLLSARQKRKPLLRDDKVLTSWNGLMIRAFANAGRILKEPEHVKAAEKAALFILTNMRDDKKRLQRTWRKGKAKLNAYVDDYAFFVSGLLALHQATDDKKWLNAARNLTDTQIRDYWSKVGGGFFFTPHYHEELIARTRNAYDAVLPSGNAVAVRNLVELSKRTGVEKYREHAKDTIRAFASNIENTPTGTAHMALAVAEYLDAGGDPKEEGKQKATDAKIRPISSSQSKDAGKKATVTAKAYLSVDKFPVGGSCRVAVLLQIKDGWHINANPPKPKNMIPTKLSIRSKAGVKLKDVKYPKGKAFELKGFDEKLSVYDGKVAVYGTLEIPEKIAANLKADEIELRIRYQACNESRCLPPKTIKLKGNVSLARPGKPVKPVNAKLFAKPKKKERESR